MSIYWFLIVNFDQVVVIYLRDIKILWCTLVNVIYLDTLYWLLFHICNANSTVSKVSRTAGGSFGGTCDGVLYDVDISIEHTKDIFFGSHFAVRQEGLCNTCFLLLVCQWSIKYIKYVWKLSLFLYQSLRAKQNIILITYRMATE